MRFETYKELSFFDGYAFAHIAAWEERARLMRLRELSRRAIANRR